MSEPVTSETFAVGQSVRHLKDPRLLQALGRYSNDVNVPRQRLVVEPDAPDALRGDGPGDEPQERGRHRGQEAPAGHVHAANR
jgi:hypothetical protein